jgi:hypothetical protein
MTYSKRCAKCGKDFTIGEGQLGALSRTEELISAKEGMDFTRMVKVTCPHCGTSSLAPRTDLRPEETPTLDALDLATYRRLEAAARRITDLLPRAFESPGPLFNESRRRIIEAWVSNFAKNIADANRAVVEGRDTNGNTISRDQVGDGLNRMCSEYREGLKRLEDVCGSRVRQEFETLLSETSECAAGLKRAAVSKPAPAGNGETGRARPEVAAPTRAKPTAPMLWEREPGKAEKESNVRKTSRVPELDTKLAEAAWLLDHSRGAWFSWIAALAGFFLVVAPPWFRGEGLRIGWGLLGALGGLLVGALVVQALHSGPWGVKAALKRICRESGLGEGDLLEHLPARLQNAPDVLEFLDEAAFRRGMERNRTDIEISVNTALAQPKNFNERAIGDALSATEAKDVDLVGLFQMSSSDERAPIQVLASVSEAVAKERQRLIAERNRRAGDLMMSTVGSNVDINTALQHCLQQAGDQMSPQFGRFYLGYGILNAAVAPMVKNLSWHEAVDTMMGWPGETPQSLGLGAFLQGYWQDGPSDAISPTLLASRTMCWVYFNPKKWETLRRLLEDAALHESGTKGGKTHAKALQTQWRQFAQEISRHAELLSKREEHKAAADTVKKQCASV